MVFMKKTYTLFLLALLTCFKLNAQISAYSRTALTGLTYTSITGGTVISTNAGLSSTSMSSNDDDGAVTVTLPFTFTYNGNTFTQVTFCTNGWVGMGNQLTVSTSDGKTPGNFFTTVAPANTLAPWFKDITANFPSSGSGSLVHGAYGTGIYAFEWKNAGASWTSTTTDLINFMVVLYGPTSATPGRIEFLYGTQSGTLSTGAAIGIEDATGGTGNYINALTGTTSATTTATAWPGNGNGYRFDPPPPCSGTPAPGNTLSTINPVCPGQSFILSLQTATTGTGVTYQWQSSPNGTTWTNISAATASTLTTSQTAATYYRCGVTCSSTTTFSNSLLLNMNTFLNCYCVANQTTGCGSNNEISNVTFSTLNNTTICTGVPSFTDYSSTVAAPNASIGATLPISVTVGTGGTEYVGVWIDYSQNGTFETTEYTSIGNGNGVAIVNNITIPASATPGLTKMRVRLRTGTAIANTEACTAFANGETEDYNVNLVCNAPTFTTHPTSTTLCVGTNITLTAAATGSGINYQWQVNTGTGFANVANGGVYSGATTGSLLLTAPTASFNGYQYRCISSVLCTTTTATSNIATLTLGNATTIVSNPINTTVCNGDPVSFSVNVTATNPGYQWQVHDGTGYYNLTNTGIYSNVNTATLNISSATAGINGYGYRCVVTGVCAPVTVISATASLTIGTAIPVVAQPANTTICSGGTAMFSVVTAGASVSYQWQVNTGSGFANVTNGTDYSGATTAALSVLNTPLGFSTYQYRCVLSNSCVSPFFTNVATLSVQQSPIITAHPTSVTSCDFQNVGFSISTTGAGLSYQWQINTGLGFVNLTNAAPYSGVFTTTLGVANVQAAMNTYQYRCVVTGTCVPAVASNPATLTINTRPVITGNPVGVVVCNGSATSFTVAATGTTLTYQWQADNGAGYVNLSNTGIYSGATTSILSLSAVTNTLHGSAYRCVIGGTCAPTVTSAAAMLYINSVPVIFSQPVNKQVCAGSATVFSIGATAATQANPLSYQWQVNTGSGFANLTNAAPYSNVTTANMTITGATTTLNGYNYRCVVSNTTCTPTVTSANAQLTVNTLPAVAGQPSTQVVCPGATATFSITGTGTGIGYQWQVNTGTGFNNIPGSAPNTGANTPTLSIANISLSMNNYQYRCVVKGTCTPDAISAAALLTVLNPITINSNSAFGNVCEGGTVKLGVQGIGAGITYQWQIKQLNGTYVNLSNTPPYSAVTTDSLRISGTPASLNNRIYRCVLTENQLCGLLYYTNDIILSVTAAPVVSPSTLLAGPGKVATFSVPPTGTGYQWQENDNSGNGYRNLADGGMYSGVYTNTLRVGPATYSLNGNMYRCVVDGACMYTVTSTSGQLIVDPTLSVTNIKTTDGIAVYPNPASGNEINIAFKQILNGNILVKVMDKMGKTVYAETLQLDNKNTLKIQLPDMAAGMYMLQVVSEQNNIAATAQFVKQ